MAPDKVTVRVKKGTVFSDEEDAPRVSRRNSRTIERMEVENAARALMDIDDSKSRGRAFPCLRINFILRKNKSREHHLLVRLLRKRPMRRRKSLLQKNEVATKTLKWKMKKSLSPSPNARHANPGRSFLWVAMASERRE